jgi:hypothetical protein
VPEEAGADDELVPDAAGVPADSEVLFEDDPFDDDPSDDDAVAVEPLCRLSVR